MSGKKSVGNLAIIISGDASPLMAAFDKAKSGAKSLASGLMSGGPQAMLAGFAAAAGSFSLDAIASGVSSLASTIYDVGESAITSAAKFEMQSTAMGVMLGNAEKGTQMMKNLENLAIATPYDTDSLADVAQQMLGMGITANNIIPAISRIGDIAAGDSEKLKRLSMAYSQVQAKGRLMGEELLQFAEAGVGIEEFAKAAGMGLEKFRSEMQAGRVGAEVATIAINNLTSEGGKFYKMNATVSGKAVGQWNGLMESISKLKREIGTIALEKLDIAGRLGASADSLEPLLEKIRGPLTQAFTWLGHAADAVWESATPLANTFLAALQPIYDTFVGTLPTIKELKKSGGEMFAEWVKYILDLIDRTATFAGVLLSPVVAMTEILSILGVIPETMHKVFESTVKTMTHFDLSARFADEFKKRVKGVGDEAKKTAKEVEKIAVPDGPSALAKQVAADAQKGSDKGSALEEYNRTQAALVEASRYKILDEKGLIYGVSQAFDKLAKEVGDTFENKIPEIMSKGSKEAEMAIIRASSPARNEDPQRRVEEVLKRAEQLQKRTAENTRRIYEAIRNMPTPEPVKI